MNSKITITGPMERRITTGGRMTHFRGVDEAAERIAYLQELLDKARARRFEADKAWDSYARDHEAMEALRTGKVTRLIPTTKGLWEVAAREAGRFGVNSDPADAILAAVAPEPKPATVEEQIAKFNREFPAGTPVIVDGPFRKELEVVWSEAFLIDGQPWVVLNPTRAPMPISKVHHESEADNDRQVVMFNLRFPIGTQVNVNTCGIAKTSAVVESEAFIFKDHVVVMVSDVSSPVGISRITKA